MSTPTLILGSEYGDDWELISEPAQQGNPEDLCYDFYPIALWSANSVNLETYSTPKRLGIVAFHASGPANGNGGIEKVTIIGNNGTPLDITEMTFNEISGYWEFQFNVPTLPTDGPVEIRAIIYPMSGVPYVMQGGYCIYLDTGKFLPEPDGCVVLLSNANGNYNGGELHVNISTGNDSNSGTIGSPLSTIPGAINKANASFGTSNLTIYLAAGTYQMDARPGNLSVAGWTHFKAEVGVDRDDVIIRGRVNGDLGSYTALRLTSFEDISFYMIESDIGPFYQDNINHTCYTWIKGCKFVSDRYTTTYDATIFSNVCQGRYMHKSAANDRNVFINGRKWTDFTQAQDFDVINTSGDCLNSNRLTRGFTVQGLTQNGPDHTDLIQGYSMNPGGNCIWMDGIVTNNGAVNGFLFFDWPKNRIGFINLVLSLGPNGSSGTGSCFCGGSNNIYWHLTMPDQQLQITTDPNNHYGVGLGALDGRHSIQNCIASIRFSGGDYAPLATYSDYVAASEGLSKWDYNQFLPGGLTPGTNYVQSLPTWYDVEAGDFRADDSLLVPAFIPFDATQNRRQSLTSAGAYLRSDEAPSQPVGSFNSGIYGPERELILTGDGGGLIYYTMDGSTPTDASTLYTTSIPIIESCTLKTKCYVAGTSSPLLTLVFQIITNGTPAPPSFTF